MTYNNVSIEDVRALVAERQRYDDWLSALEARRAETPARVYERVFADYQERRAQVMSRLHMHVDGLSELSNQLDQRLSALEGTLAGLEDERAEAMLRTAVGEFDDQRWDEVRTAVEGRIASLGQEREALLSEVDDVRTLLSSARVEAEPELAAEDESSPVEADEVVVSQTSGEGAAAESEPDSGDFEIVDSMTSRSLPDVEISIVAEVPVRPATPAHEQSAVADKTAVAASGAERDYEEALALFSDPVKQPDAGFLKSLEGIEAEVDASAAGRKTPLAAPQVSTSTVTPPSAGADAFDDLAFLRSVIEPEPAASASTASTAASKPASSAPQKTLRCTECGTMNLPTEWYCERCGGELAAF